MMGKVPENTSSKSNLAVAKQRWTSIRQHAALSTSVGGRMERWRLAVREGALSQQANK